MGKPLFKMLSSSAPSTRKKETVLHFKIQIPGILSELDSSTIIALIAEKAKRDDR